MRGVIIFYIATYLILTNIKVSESRSYSKQAMLAMTTPTFNNDNHPSKVDAGNVVIDMSRTHKKSKKYSLFITCSCSLFITCSCLNID